MTKEEFRRGLTAVQNQKRAQHDREIRELIEHNRRAERDYMGFKCAAVERCKKWEAR